MNRFAYQVYYEYSGPTKDSPFRIKKTAVEIEDALSSFPHDLRHFLADLGTEVSHDKMRRTANSILVVVATTETEQQVDDAVKRCLNSFDLFGKKLKQA